MLFRSTDDDHADSDRHRRARGGGDQDGTTRQPYGAYTPLRLDARPQSRRRLNPVRGASCERDRLLLLAKTLCELRRCRDARLERGSTFRRQRPVGKRRQLGALSVGRVSSATSHGHGKRNRSPERAAASLILLLDSAETVTVPMTPRQPKLFPRVGREPLGETGSLGNRRRTPVS